MSSPKGVDLLSCYDLKKDYDAPSGNLEVLKGVTFSIRPGNLSFIIGRSGSGKSTLLHLLAGLDRPTSGKIVFEGEDITSKGDKVMARIRNRRIGIVFQSYHLLPELTLLENVVLPSMIASLAVAPTGLEAI